MDTPQSISNAKTEVIAHRGASAYAPENTLAAFQLALEMKSDYIELDVHLTQDNQVIVIHDATLERTTDGSGLVREKTLEELKKLDAGKWFDSKFEGEKLPTLAEVMDTVNGQTKLLIEVKVDEKDELYEGLMKEVLQIIQERNAASWCVLQAFDSRYLAEIAQSNVKIEYHQLIIDDFSPIPAHIGASFQLGSIDKGLGFAAMNPYFKLLSKGKVENWQKEGLKVFTYTVDEEADIKRMVEFGVNGIITNRPDLALELLGRK